ncbi:HAMP domain-containing sensor histidine kinase [Bacteroides sp.]|uniref:sensor histidine kinase n=1 Tax=Bacteroides sp. TaxID=29523 RepID=UPI0026058018|nr:HAMP domain-containing sensor histidine kinase [Bacteroides sp.]
MNNDHLRLIETLMEDNFNYSQDVSISNIIQWEDEVVTYYQKKKDYERMFLMKGMAIYANSFNGRITEALKKANTMLAQAQQMDYKTGIALSYIALGDTYTNAEMMSEAAEEYWKAINIIYQIPESEKLQERVFIQLVPTLIRLNRMKEAQVYLERMNSIYEHTQLNPFLLYAYQAYYNIYTGDFNKARQYIIDAEITSKEKPSYLHTSTLKYIQAEYAKETGNYDLAIRLYKELTNTNRNSYIYTDNLRIKNSIAKIYTELGRDKEACEIYQTINTSRDSINAHAYTAQINLLRTIYQVDRLDMANQKQWNRILTYLIIGGSLILIIFVLFVILIRKENKRLAASKLKLIDAKSSAESSIRTKSLFLSNMSHEIRTPLNALSGFSAILTDSNIDKEIRQQCNDIIQQNSDLLLKLIDDVVDLSSLERGKMQFSLGTHEAVSLCRNVIDTVEKIKQTAAVVAFQTSLEQLELYTDEARLQQLLINLLINATKFTSEGSITLSLEVKEGMALFSVTDTGCGIAPEKQSKIFNRFEKLDENAQGSGLGLSICQLIVEHFGGEIWIDTEYKGGCRFLFTHPIHSNTPEKEVEK